METCFVSGAQSMEQLQEGCEGTFGQDIWTEYGNIIFPYIPEGMTLYGEICGYLTGNAKMIQQDYDYGCREGENFLMIYRATKHEDGRLRELSIDEVIQLTDAIKARMHDANDPNVGRIFNIGGVKVYQGTVAQLLAGIGNVPDPGTPDGAIEHIGSVVTRDGFYVWHFYRKY